MQYWKVQKSIRKKPSKLLIVLPPSEISLSVFCSNIVISLFPTFMHKYVCIYMLQSRFWQETYGKIKLYRRVKHKPQGVVQASPRWKLVKWDKFNSKYERWQPGRIIFREFKTPYCKWKGLGRPFSKFWFTFWFQYQPTVTLI